MRRPAFSAWGDRPNQKTVVASRHVLRTLIERQDGRCFWCRYFIVQLSAREPGWTIIEQTHFDLTWTADGETFTAPIASIDHVKPKWMRGSNEATNLVACCVACNADRAFIHEPSKLAKRNQRRRRQCVTNIGHVLANALRDDAS